MRFDSLPQGPRVAKATLVPNRLVACGVTVYIEGVIKSFRHKGIQRFFETGSKGGIQSKHTERLRLQLSGLDDAKNPKDMDAPNWKLHRLKGALKGHWFVWVDENWRLTFAFEREDVVLVDYQDYH
jgi:proteic killer suppression protein